MRPISRCLNVTLSTICQQALHIEQLTQVVQGFLPAHYQAHYHVGSFNKGCLKLIVVDAAWASQLRYELPSLRDALREAGFYQLTAIKIEINLLEKKLTPQVSAKEMRLSSQAQKTILEAAENMSYPPLKEAWMKLGK